MAARRTVQAIDNKSQRDLEMEAGDSGNYSYEMVDHPKHYNEHPKEIECIDVIEDFPHNLGAAIKYIWRAGLKPGTSADQDLRKAIWYLERERTRLASS